MLKKLEQLRGRTEAYRRRVAFGMALSITAIIFVGWLAGWLSAGEARTDSYAEGSGTRTETPLAVIRKRVSNGWAGLMNGWAELEKGIDGLRAQVRSIDDRPEAEEKKGSTKQK